jgi:hypothetical protein
MAAVTDKGMDMEARKVRGNWWACSRRREGSVRGKGEGG